MKANASVKYPKYVPAVLALATLGMIVANLFGAGIPWMVVFAPILFQLAVLVLGFAIMGLLVLFIHSLKVKADKK